MSSIQYTRPSVPRTQNSIGDLITQLPVDQSQPTNQELQIVNSLFTKHKSTMNFVIKEVKDSLLIGALFIVFSLPITDTMIRKVVPMSEKSLYVMLAIKAVAVMALYWLIKHFYLSRKNK